MSRRDSISRFISLSSTSRTFGITSPSMLGANMTVGSTLRKILPHDGGEILGLDGALGNDLAHASAQAIVFLRAQIEPGEDHHRDVAPFCAFTDFVQHRKAVHFRHHEIEQDYAWHEAIRQQVDGSASVGSLDHVDIEALQLSADELARIRIIIND